MTVRLVPDRFEAYDEEVSRRRAEEQRDDLVRARERAERADEHGSTGWLMPPEAA